MTVREIVISVTGAGSVEAVRDDGARSGPGKIKSSGLDADLIRLFERWLSERDRAWRRDEITVIGRLLHRALLEGVVGTFVDHTLLGLGAKDRIRLQLEFPVDGSGGLRHLAAVPWEYLYSPDSAGRAGFFLATDPRFILCRYIPLATGRPALSPEETRLRLLAVVSQPDEPCLGKVISGPVLLEIRRLVRCLPISVDVLRDPTIEKLGKALRTSMPHIVHFMGHGEYDATAEEGRIALLGNERRAQWVTDRMLVEILQHARANPRVIILHSCDGGRVDYRANFAGMAPQLIRSGVQCVVAMQYAVTNGVAVDFSRAFYRCLSDGAPVDEAVQEGRWSITKPSATSTGDPRLLGVPVVYLYSRDAVIRPAGSPPMPGEGESS